MAVIRARRYKTFFMHNTADFQIIVLKWNSQWDYCSNLSGNMYCFLCNRMINFSDHFVRFYENVTYTESLYLWAEIIFHLLRSNKTYLYKTTITGGQTLQFLLSLDIFHMHINMCILFYRLKGNVQFRLVNGTSTRGRLEVNYGGTWGTVCDDHFDTNAAKVACKALNLP